MNAVHCTPETQGASALSRPTATGWAWPGALLGRGRWANRMVRPVVRWLAVLGVAVASYFITSRLLFQSVEVVGQSMKPTLKDSQRYILNRWLYWVRAPQRSDVVVILDPVSGRHSVKRVVGLPGDAVYLKEGSVWVNGRKLEEPYLPPFTRTYPEGSLPEQWLRCSKDQYVVMGDNRKNSSDSRSYGPVRRRDVLGRIFP
jgi:signal peptidase I